MTDNHNIEFEKQLGYSTQEIMELYKHFAQSRRKYENMWKILDAYDRGLFWDIIKNNIPNYSIKPDTNYINYVKTSIVNSLYTGTYRGDVFPRSYIHRNTVNKINEFLEYIWDKLNMTKYTLQAGERAALLNFGAIEFGWNADIIDGADTLFHGELEAKFIDNMSLYLDPSTINPYKGRAMFVAEEVAIVELMNEARFADRMQSYLEKREAEKNKGLPSFDPSEYGKGYYGQRTRDSKDETVRLLTCYYKYQPKGAEGYRIDQIWLIDDGYILDVKKDIKPKTFPIRILYASPPVADPYGTPVTRLVLYNTLAINILDSIDATTIYSASKRARIVSSKANINLKAFAKEGNNPDKLWVVDGDPNNAVRYIDIPELPRDRYLLIQRLEKSIMRVSGVDDRYTGRDTGSVQTTGGMDIMNQRISMSDNIRISLLQDFIKEITELVLSFYLEYGGEKRPFPVYKNSREVDAIEEINFEQLKKDDIKFDCIVNVTPHLPNNVMRRAEAANTLMEKQMQYQMDPPLITPEEWLEMQDFPFKHHIVQRLRADRMRNDKEELMSDMVNYAGLVQQGVRPEQAINMLAQERQLKREQPGLGNVGNIQRRQMG